MSHREISAILVFESKSILEEKSFQRTLEILKGEVLGVVANDGKRADILKVEIHHYKCINPQEIAINFEVNISTIHPKLADEMMIDFAVAKVSDRLMECSLKNNDIVFRHFKQK